MPDAGRQGATDSSRGEAKERSRLPAWRYALPLVLLGALAAAVALPAGLDMPARLALFAFGAATILWTTSSLQTAYVAFGAVVFLVVTRTIPEDKLFGALDSDVVWLLIGTFIISAAFAETGLSARMSAAIARGETTVGGMIWRLTFGMIPLAFIIPSTSGRAAIMLPLFGHLADAADDRRIVRALALLIPCVILVATTASLVGAGSHLIADDLLARVGGTRIGFGAWALYGLPFATAASALTAFVIGRTFLDRDLRSRRLEIRAERPEAMSAAEWRTIAVAGIMIGLWMTDGLHPFGIALVAFAGAFVLTTPIVGVLSWKAGIEAVSWNLILFVGAALVLGQTLIDTGAADWLIKRIVGASGLASAQSSFVILSGVIVISVTSHLYFTSHTARTAALLPPLLLLGRSLGVHSSAMMFVATVGMDYCLTFPVSSKALLLFEDAGQDAWDPADLFKLSCILLPIYAALMILFYYGYWNLLGLDFHGLGIKSAS